MSIITLGWVIGLHSTLAVWLGILASAWKKRSAWRWIGVGLLTSLLGVVILARMPRVGYTQRIVETDMHLQHLDGTSLLQ